MNLTIKFFRQQCRLYTLCSAMLKRMLVCVIILICFNVPGASQATNAKYAQPSWWIGAAGAANFNFYSGSIQRANEVTTFPSAFGKGFGTGGFIGGLIEYHRPGTRWGFMLQEGLDNRKAEFKKGNQKLLTSISYFTVEPSLRLAPFKSNFYLYGGPRLGLLLSSSFIYKRPGFSDYPDRSANPDAKLFISGMRKNPVSMQVGAGYDIPIWSKDTREQFVISPFVSWFPTMWRKNIRTIEPLYLNTVRAGIAIKVGRGRQIAQEKLPMPPEIINRDRDGDGILDSLDRCPDNAGPKYLIGCPDRDGDGIADIDDQCPDVPGFTRYQGCPVPDTDGDGLNDEVDKCPRVAGLPRYQGCPIPDTDGDGINDEEDKCINEKGPASNFGCPVISEEIIRKVNTAAQNIFFETGKSKLLAKSFSKLNEVVSILNENPSFKISIEGHTDDVGKDDYNQTLSNDRAASVKAYLVSRGIMESRLKSAGYGETKPIADNKTVAGRGKNRRVEMVLSNY